MIKILYVITGLGLGGAEKVVSDLADQMAKKGHQVKIAYLTGEVLVRPQSKEIEVIYLGLKNAKNFLLASIKYHHLIQNYQPDIVHAHMVHANLFARINRIGTKIPKLICTAHNSNEGGWLRMKAYKITNFLSDFNTNVSKEATRIFINKGAFSKKNILTIYNGIDLEKFTFQDNNKFRNSTDIYFLSVGRFNVQKDYPNLLKAISLLNTSDEHRAEFFIAGDGELRPQIESLIHDLKLGNEVKLLGTRDDIPQLMKQAKFFILSSQYEGFGLVVAEAMASGTFVIATNCGGVKEVMGDTGILIPPQDSLALAKAIRTAMTLKTEEIQLNNLKARRRVEALFSLEKSVNRWLEIYEAK